MTTVINDITVVAPPVIDVAVEGTQGPSGILSLTAEAIDDAGGDPTARAAALAASGAAANAQTAASAAAAAAAAAQSTANGKADATATATALAKRTESYVQSSEPVTTAPAMWFDTSDPNFLTLKIQRG